MTRTIGYVLDFQNIDRSQVALVGGKGANLGELARMDALRVPSGFCVTTDAFDRMLADAPQLDATLERLTHLQPDDRHAIRTISEEARRIIEATNMPADVAEDVTDALGALGDQRACAVRSSATAEDLPTASFAGQQDSYLNVVGPAAILVHISRCWASLFTERAVTYRLRNNFDHRKVRMAVVVQQMVFPQVSGILFTADPVSGNRKLSSVEASFGLGEALVSGRVNADVYKVRDDKVISRTLGSKQLAIHAAPACGTREQAIALEQQQQSALTDAQVLRLTQLGRRIEAHFGKPQDIEWCLANDEFHIVQSRPITTLFPVPAASDNENHVYLSVGHQQMMTDPMKPLGLSLFQLTAKPPMLEAAGRLFVDVTRSLVTPAGRTALLDLMGKSDPLFRDALQTILDRGDFVPALPDAVAPILPTMGKPVADDPDPALINELIARTQAALATVKREIQHKSGPALLDFILADIQELRRVLFDPQSLPLIMAAMDATWWLNENLEAWLGEKGMADALTQSVPGNVTSEMGLALLDVADVIRPFPEVVNFLQRKLQQQQNRPGDESFLEELPNYPGGQEARDAIQSWLEVYGMRCVGEIDVTRTRWSECPEAIVPMILSNIRNFESGAGARRFEQGRQQAWHKEQEVLQRLRALPDGENKAQETKRMINRVRTFSGYREYPKYGMICRYFIYKQGLLAEAERLLQAGVLRDKEDIFYLRFEELHDVVRARQVDHALIQQRRDAHRTYESLTPPRVLTSGGEAVTGTYRRDDVPPGALIGLAVSTGVVEGRARVILNIADTDLGADDILVTAYTDPSWTPLFVAIRGLVTEVGGLMTHGAVIAREYGLPAVVGVERATTLIRDGQRIRVNGTEGYVEILS